MSSCCCPEVSVTSTSELELPIGETVDDESDIDRVKRGIRGRLNDLLHPRRDMVIERSRDALLTCIRGWGDNCQKCTKTEWGTCLGEGERWASSRRHGGNKRGRALTLAWLTKKYFYLFQRQAMSLFSHKIDSFRPSQPASHSGSLSAVPTTSRLASSLSSSPCLKSAQCGGTP